MPTALSNPVADTQKNTASITSTKSVQHLQLLSLPQAVIQRIILYAPINCTAALAACCRRLKVICSAEVLYSTRLYALGVKLPCLDKSCSSTSSESESELSRAWNLLLVNGSEPLIPLGESTRPCRDALAAISLRLSPVAKRLLAQSEIQTSQADLALSAAEIVTTARWAQIMMLESAPRISAAVSAASGRLEAEAMAVLDRGYLANDTDSMKASFTCLFYLGSITKGIAHLAYKSDLLFGADAGGHIGSYIAAMEEELARFAEIIAVATPSPKSAQYELVRLAFTECIGARLTKDLQQAKARDKGDFLKTLTHVFSSSASLAASLSHWLEPKAVENLLHDVLAPFESKYLDYELASFVSICNALAAARRAENNPPASPSNSASSAVSTQNAEARRESKFRERVLVGMKTALAQPQKLVEKALRRTSAGISDEDRRASKTSTATPGKFTTLLPIVEMDRKRARDFSKLLDTKLVDEIIEENLTALKRCIVMKSPTGNVRPFVQKVFCALLSALYECHIQHAFKEALGRFDLFRTTDEMTLLPLEEFFDMISITDSVLASVHAYFKSQIGPFLDQTGNDFHDPAVQAKRRFEMELDNFVAAGLDKAIVVLMAQVEHILASEQTVQDFNPSNNDNSSIEMKPSDACLLAIDCMQRHLKLLEEVASERSIANVFAAELGHRFFIVICKHIKQQRISVPVGGFRLMCDMSAYHAWAACLGNDEVLLSYDRLKELTNIFVVEEPKQLKPILKDMNRYAGVFRVEEVYEFAACRSDYVRIAQDIKESQCMIS